MVKLALEPEWEAKFEPNSYGFRPGRSCHDAIEAIFANLKYVPRYVLDADIKGCFHNINQEKLLEKLTDLPLAAAESSRSGSKQECWKTLTSNPLRLARRRAGSSLHYLPTSPFTDLRKESVKSFPYSKVVNGVKKHIYRPKVIRYADDFVILHEELAVIEKCKEIANEWLAEIGLELKENKTRITHTLHKQGKGVGFDFLGFNIRQFPVGKNHYGKSGGAAKRETEGKVPFKTIIKPSKEAVQRHYRAIANTIGRTQAQSSKQVLIMLLNPIIRGWSNYYSTVVSKKAFNKLDHLVCMRLFRWGRRHHGHHKGRRWVADRYFNTQRNKGSLRPWDFIANNRTTLH